MDGDRTRVMVVEDEKITAMELQDRLTAMGYHVIAMVMDMTSWRMTSPPTSGAGIVTSCAYAWLQPFRQYPAF